MPIAFDAISLPLVPGVYVEYSNAKASQGLPPLPNRVLLIASMLASGSAAPATLKQISRDTDGDAYFGVGSQAARMCKKFKKASKFTEVWAIGLEDDPGAVKATKTLTVTGTATTAGTLHLLVHGERAPVGIAKDDTPGASSKKIANKVAENAELLYEASFEMTATYGGTPTDGDYDLIFTGFGLGAPVTVKVTRAGGVPADNNALAAEGETQLTTAMGTTLAGVVVFADSATNVLTFRIAGGLAAGTVTTAAPAPGTLVAAETGITHLVCKHAALFGNDLDVRLNYQPREDLEMPGGVSLVIAAGVSGTLDPDIADAIDVLGDKQWTKVVPGWSGDANIDALEAELADRWGPMVQKDGVAFVGITGSFSTLTTYADSRNSQFTVLCPPDGTSSPTPPWERATVVAAVSSNEPDPARSVRTLPLTGCLPAADGDRFTVPERDLLLNAGIATFKADDGGRLLIERLVTSYTTDPSSGLPDASYRNVEVLQILAALRFTTRARFALKYPRHKLAADGTDYGPGQPVMTPSVGRAEMLGLFEQWQSQAWVQNFEQFAEELIVEINSQDPDRLDILLGPSLIKQLMVVAAQIQFQ